MRILSKERAFLREKRIKGRAIFNLTNLFFQVALWSKKGVVENFEWSYSEKWHEKSSTSESALQTFQSIKLAGSHLIFLFRIQMPLKEILADDQNEYPVG
jgi:hypothetical protein